MELEELIAILSRPDAYSYPVAHVEVRQTHISVVFLAGDFVFKLKKPVELGFLDFSTLEKRHRYCNEEVRLNRRLAPQVYLGVVPITCTPHGLKVDGTGVAIEWAVKMRRLPDDATLQMKLRDGTVTTELAAALGRRIASFHQQAEGNADIAAYGRFQVVAQNARENFQQSRSQINVTVSRSVFARLEQMTEDILEAQRPLIESRAERGRTRDTHGDLHSDHIYVFPDRSPPDDVWIIDCIEFNQRFRFADPIADMAFLFMDFKFHGRTDLACAFADAYIRAANDEEGRYLLGFYSAYRAIVRGKVEGFALAEKELSATEAADALIRAKRHWLLALSELEPPDRRPCLVIVGGLPGTGKSTLARCLVQQAGFQWVRSDVVRKELAGLSSHDSARQPFGAGIYSPDWTDRTYSECLRRAEHHLFNGERVLIDASFAADQWRRHFIALADRLGIPIVFFHCTADVAVVRARLEDRVDDPSDAGWEVYQTAQNKWEVLGPEARRIVHVMNTNGPMIDVEQQALQTLSALNLFVDNCEATPSTVS